MLQLNLSIIEYSLSYVKLRFWQLIDNKRMMMMMMMIRGTTQCDVIIRLSAVWVEMCIMSRLWRWFTLWVRPLATITQQTIIATVHQPVTVLTRSSADADKPARRVERSVKVTNHGTIRYVRYMVSYYCPVVILSLKRAVFQIIFDFEKCPDLKYRSEVTQGHRNQHGSIRHPRRMTSY